METSGIFDEPDPRRKLAIEVEGKKFWVPRDTLALYSPVFNTMLYGEFAEANKDVITLPGKKAKDVEELLLCLIPHPRQKEIDYSNFDLLMALSDEYQIDEIPVRAERLLMKKLEMCQKADKAMLNLLVIGSKYEIKDFLSLCIERCAKELPFSQLKEIFPKLTAEVMASLTLAVLEPPKDSPCQFTSVGYGKYIRCFGCHGQFAGGHRKCLWCGNIYCSMCVRNDQIKKCSEVRGHP